MGKYYGFTVYTIGYLNSALGWNAGAPLTWYNAGTGAPILYTYGGGGSGTTILDAQAQVDGGMLTQLQSYGVPDVVVINDGYNSINLTGDTSFVAHFQTLVSSIRAQFPDTPVVILTQNMFGVDVGNQAGAMGPWFASLATAYGLSAVTTGAVTGRPGLNPVLQQTNVDGVWMLDTRQATDAIVNAGQYSSITFDGIHPNSYGYELQAQFMLEQLTPLRPKRPYPGGASVAVTSGTPNVGVSSATTPGSTTIATTPGNPWCCCTCRRATWQRSDHHNPRHTRSCRNERHRRQTGLRSDRYGQWNPRCDRSCEGHTRRCAHHRDRRLPDCYHGPNTGRTSRRHHHRLQHTGRSVDDC